MSQVPPSQLAHVELISLKSQETAGRRAGALGA